MGVEGGGGREKRERERDSLLNNIENQMLLLYAQASSNICKMTFFFFIKFWITFFCKLHSKTSDII